MAEVLASSLPEKPVLSMDGRKLSIVHNLTVDLQTGLLESLIIKTERTADDLPGIQRTDEGHLRMPAAAIRGLDDQLVVDLTHSD